MQNVEIWKDVIGFEGIYQVSNLGRVKSLKRIKKDNFNNMKDKKADIIHHSMDR
jgi:hypothetical protein